MSDYLWDRTGEADPDVEQLENLLGAFAHRPRPLELPEVETRARRAPWLRYAAAAAVLVAVVAGALVTLRLARTEESVTVADTAPSRAVEPRGSQTPSALTPPPGEASTPKEEPAPRANRGGELANKQRRTPRRAAPSGEARATRHDGGGGSPAAREVAEGRQAKERLMYALRLTGDKLEEVRRKVQGEPDAEDAPEGRSRTR